MNKSIIKFLYVSCIMLCIVFCTNCNKDSFDENECFENFDFSELNQYDSTVAQNIKETCDSTWDLCDMIDSTFRVSKLKNNEYSILCDGIIDSLYIRYRIWTDPSGNWVENSYYYEYFDDWPYCIEFFNFPVIDSIDSLVYEEIKLTCDRWWDLCNMIESTFTITTDQLGYVANCEGVEENKLYQFGLRVDLNGKYINSVGKLLKKDEKEIIHIKAIDINEMAKLHLQDFDLSKERTVSLETEYGFFNKSDSSSIDITTGIFSTQDDAINYLLQRFKYESIRMIEGAYQGTLIGDKLWWYELKKPSGTILITIIFVRYNSFVLVHSFDYDILTLAKQIDDDILKEESYITFQ